ncbi:MAG: hypothetical protein IPM69_19315 [Ignavibacteria bacterium]|nr:hypothetical protein [Ignavibacteria bacterium]
MFQKTLLCLFLLLLPTSIMAQGMIDGFMRGEGKSVVALSYSSESYKDFYKNTTLVQEPNLGRITTTSVSLFTAVGITNSIDVLLSLPYISATSDQGYWQTQSSLQDLNFAVKWRPLQVKLSELGTLSAILACGVSIPTTNYVANAPVAIGHHSPSADARLVVNYMTSFGLFAAVQTGYIRHGDVELDRLSLEGNMKTNVPDAIDFSAKVGYGNSEFYIDAWMQSQSSRGGTNIGETDASFPSNGISFTRLGLTGYYPLKFIAEKFGLSLSGATTLNGRNIGKSNRISIGAVYEFSLWN